MCATNWADWIVGRSFFLPVGNSRIGSACNLKRPARPFEDPFGQTCLCLRHCEHFLWSSQAHISAGRVIKQILCQFWASNQVTVLIVTLRFWTKMWPELAQFQWFHPNQRKLSGTTQLTLLARAWGSCAVAYDGVEWKAAFFSWMGCSL